MYKLEEILVPIDFSPRSLRALEQAGQIALKLGAKVFAFHSYKRPHAGKKSTAVHNKGLFEHKTKELKKKYSRIVSGFKEFKKIENEIFLFAGISDEKIIDLIQKKKIDLIISATHGTSGIDLVLGSKTQNLIHALKGPILVLPDGADVTKSKKLALAMKFHAKFPIEAVEPMLVFAKMLNAKLYIFEVLAHNEPPDKARKKLEKKILDLSGGEVNITFDTQVDRSVENGMKKFCKTFDIDLIGLIPLHRNPIVDIFHESLTEKMAGIAKIPVLSLAENYESRKL